MKLCRKCKAIVENPIKQSDCISCVNSTKRKKYAEDTMFREELLSKNKNKSRTREGKTGRMFIDAKGRAKKANFPFNIDKEDIFIPDRCPYLNIPLVLDNDGKQDNSPSLDKIKPALGYVKGNVEVISEKANRIKNDATPEEIMMIALRMERKYADTQ